MLTAEPRRETHVATAIMIAVLVIVSLALPFAALVGAPALLVLGVRLIRGDPDAGARTLGWVAITCGVAVAGVLLLFGLGLIAAGGGSLATDGVTSVTLGP